MTSADKREDNRKATPLQPPAGSVPVEGNPDKPFRKTLIAFVVLLVIGLGVLLLLPEWVSETPRDAEKDAVVESRIDVTALRQQAEQALQRFLHLQAEMKVANAPVWGAAEWSEAEARVRSGDRLFGERRFGEAQQAYTGGIAILDKLKLERAARLDSALQAGWAALGNNNVTASLEQFAIALSIDAGNVDALRGQAQAQVRDQVLDLTEMASGAEDHSQLEEAKEHYQSALALDSAYEPANAGLIRVEQQLKEQKFRAAMNVALLALDSERFKEAASALAQAAEVSPQHEALLDARKRLQLERRQATMNRLRRQAAAQVKLENWAKAVELYKKALQLDDGAGFAHQGLVRAEQRATLNTQFNYYLDSPERLYSAEPLANAELLLGKIRAAPENEPKLAEKIKRLHILVGEARQPLPVELLSDGETEVTIYHIGRLGRFTTHQLELRPGTYTVVGVRPGFRDVRRVFSLKPGDKRTGIDIRCEERI
jgi:hypothetical protein